MVLCLPAVGSPVLHRSSPDWRDQVLYFALTDRFDDGNPRNNDQGAGEFDPRRRSHYSGGDLAGLTRRLDYLRGLGASGLWLTPPVANQWVDAAGGYTGYHGYWAEHFMRVDPHLGSLADYQRLSRELHRRGMVLVQDIVVNHTGNFFQHGPGWDPADPAASWQLNTGSKPVTAPSQPPFHLNDPRRAEDRAAAVYHWTPPVADYGDRHQELTFQMSGLDDLNTENPAVRRALRQSYGHWIRAAGVDAYRVDTAFYVPPDFFDDFLNATDPQAPGIAQVARQTGRRDFLVFGEGFGIDKPYRDEQALKIQSYMTAADGRPLLPGMLNFPLYGALNDVFARGRPPAELGHRITRSLQLHARPHRLVNFIDNHDVDRFLAGGSEAGLRQALLAMFTLPGIPVIYQGTEQGFRTPRAAMFAAGWGSGGRDHFDTAAPLYRSIAELARLRREHRLFSRGTPTVLHADSTRAGAIAWRMDHAVGGTQQQALVVMNTAESEVLVERLATGAPPGTRLRGLPALGPRADDRRVGADGTLTLRLPPRSAFVWRLVPGGRAVATTRTGPPAPQLDPLPATVFNDSAALSGSAVPGQALQLVLNGDLATAQAVTAGPDGRWQALLDTTPAADPALVHRVSVFDPGSGSASAPRSFRVERPWRPLADVPDPAGDDTGPTGQYRYPTDPSWGDNRQLDLRRVQVSGAGGALRLDLGLHRLTQSWSPANGFDHVAFTIFIELPGQAGGSMVMPGQDGALPAGLRWHRRLRVHGWSNALFTADGASATQEGTPATPAATLAVDAARHTLSLTLPAAALGGLKSLSGVRLWVTTWDYDGGYRALASEPGGHSFGGGAPGDPKWMDASEIITLP
ncbi:MAG: alpha-amylase [Rubrivivax sp.]|nr:alpha-amylase [Rubrivivax sp.]